MKVYVISKSGQPLMPTERFGKVRRLLKAGKAKVILRKPFTIQLLYDSLEITQPLILGLDTGSNYIGATVVNESGEPVFLGELETRTKEVPKNMTNRRKHRKARRRHGREKQKRRAKRAGTTFEKKEYEIIGCEKLITCKLIKPGMIKFANRKRHEKWLTPTCTHLLRTHINFVRKITNIMPIAKVNFEYAKFDLHKLDKSDVSGIDYQNGRRKGCTNNTEYVRCRDKHACQLCRKKTGEMHVHHVVWQSDNGQDTPENMVTLCKKCHNKVHTNPRTDNKIKELFKGLKKRYVHPTILNSITPRFSEWLQNTFEHVERAYGYEIKDKRREFKFPKSHITDAYLVALGSTKPHDLTNYKAYTFKQFRRHNRANIKRQEDRKYYLDGTKVAVNRNKRTGQTFGSLQDFVEKAGGSILNQLTAKPATRPQRSVKPFGMGDIIRFDGAVYTVKGFMGNYLGFVGHDRYNKNMKKAKLIVKNQGIVCI